MMIDRTLTAEISVILDSDLKFGGPWPSGADNHLSRLFLPLILDIRMSKPWEEPSNGILGTDRSGE